MTNISDTLTTNFCHSLLTNKTVCQDGVVQILSLKKVKINSTNLEPKQHKCKIRVCILRNTGGVKLKSKNGAFVCNLTFADSSGKISAVTWSNAAINPASLLTIRKLKIAEKMSIIELIDDGKVPPLTYNFIRLSELNLVRTTSCDVICVINMVDDEVILCNIKRPTNSAPVHILTDFVLASTLTPRVNDRMTIQEVQVVDASRYTCRVAVWGEEAIKFNAIIRDVIIIQAAQVCKHAGTSLLLEAGSKILFENGGQLMTFMELSDITFGASATACLSSMSGQDKLTTISDAIYNELGSDGNKTLFKTFAYLKDICTDQIAYHACQMLRCNGLVNPFMAEVPIQPQTDQAYVNEDSKETLFKMKQLWECCVCHKSFDDSCICYQLEVQITDGKESITMTMFDKVIEEMLQIPVHQVENMHVHQDPHLSRLAYGGLYKLGQRPSYV
ncbi:hypothetical protein DACRYDRAFT_18788 [Dacryopinax primogenitus]|uniref:Replication protein A OB domain-containing protein n=1 Tax=Dacryopinax primogenitus (strain DJM 731) TaxID=1858805 RepID=M5FVN8_DACPD|nr:uncharacterized protein DACRYDRAFT_18788 [Dacryopinax primogenitus]EJT97416.1 hypothetical protein DACRYDRAFT_18788 [Dacryopinax primogenitus]